eukprot:GHVS01108849.1.p1 GENE.GHVS01108849.1~~GHVS01108849.1.p1  ORF type:complete len:238 (+),score=55.86 GHVS01108849.1:209-922(+)
MVRVNPTPAGAARPGVRHSPRLTQTIAEDSSSDHRRSYSSPSASSVLSSRPSSPSPPFPSSPPPPPSALTVPQSTTHNKRQRVGVSPSVGGMIGGRSGGESSGGEGGERRREGGERRGEGGGRSRSTTGRAPGIGQRRKHRPGELALKEIRMYQNSTDLLLPKNPFSRVVREVTQRHDKPDVTYRYTPGAMAALQTAAEVYLVGVLEDARLCNLHAKRVTLQAKDLHLARRLRGRDR